jgi:hypothetical protein
MNWRAIGCLGIGIVAFVGVGILGLTLASGRAGCPAQLAWQDATWEPDRPATSSPAVGREAPVEIGTILVGLSSRRVYGPAGSTPSASPPAALPVQVAVECGDGTFQTYRTATNRGAPPSLGG